MSNSAAGTRFTARDVSPVRDIEPVDGWSLLEGEYEDGDRFTTKFYVASGPEHDVLLNVSRFDFKPTQARFAWLVGFGFPQNVTYMTGVRGPLCNASIDGAIARAAERRFAA